MTPTEERQQKIVVALFLILGKAMGKLGAKERNEISVTESEIRRAWTEKRSPVRLVSEQVKPEFQQWESEEAQWGGERTYRAVVGELDLNKTGMNFKGKCPEPDPVPTIVERQRKGRIFDLE